jgi:K+-dependent Na+/Ca+ exchanger-like protein
MFILLALVGVLLLTFYVLAIICDEFFVPALDVIADKWKLPSDVAGATLMAMGSSAPELAIAFIAVFRGVGHTDVGAGTIVGSAIFNILVITGAAAVFKTSKLRWQPVARDLCFYSVSIVALLVVFWDGRVTIAESLLFVAIYGVYLALLSQWSRLVPIQTEINTSRDGEKTKETRKTQPDENPIDILEESGDEITKGIAILERTRYALSFFIPDVTKATKTAEYRTAILAFTAAIVWIGLLSFVLVEVAVHIADILHIPAAIVALTVIAAGTSIPDLLASIAVAKQGRGDMAVSNGIGSNIFDILIGLGLPWAVILTLNGGVVEVSTDNLMASIFLLFATVIAIFTLLVLRKWVLGRKSGWLLILLYVAYIAYSVVQLMAM